MLINVQSDIKKRLLVLIITALFFISIPAATASATIGHTYTEKDYVFLVGATVGYASYGAVVRYYIAVDYSRNSSELTTYAATCLETACTYWAGKGVANLVPSAAIQAKYYQDSTNTLLKTQQLVKDVSFYQVTNQSWYAIACSGTRTQTSMGNSRIRAEGGGGVVVSGALYPAYSYTSTYSF